MRRQAGDSHFGNEAPDTKPLEVKAAERGMPLQTVVLNNADVIKAYERRLVLVRPDGHVAWRGDSPPTNPFELIDTVRGAGPRIAARRADAEFAPASPSASASSLGS